MRQRQAHQAGAHTIRIVAPSLSSWGQPDRPLLLREKFPEFWAVFGALLDDALPPSLVGFRPIGFGCRTLELDGLDAGIGLPLGVFCILRVEFGDGRRFPRVC